MPLDSNNEIYVDNAATTSMSKDVLDSANINPKQFTSEKIKIRGRTGELEIYSLENAYDLKL